MAPAGDTAEPISNGRRNAGLAVLIGATVLAPCGPTEAVLLASASLANFAYTDKLPGDFLAEFASGQECSMLKARKDGGQWCRDSFECAVYERPIYCYRTLGQIACYDKMDPHGRNSTRVR